LRGGASIASSRFSAGTSRSLACTREELEAVMKEPKRAPTREVWMHESLVDEARRLWEQIVADL